MQAQFDASRVIPGKRQNDFLSPLVARRQERLIQRRQDPLANGERPVAAIRKRDTRDLG